MKEGSFCEEERKKKRKKKKKKEEGVGKRFLLKILSWITCESHQIEDVLEDVVEILFELLIFRQGVTGYSQKKPENQELIGLNFCWVCVCSCWDQ